MQEMERKTYLKIENKLRIFSERNKIKMDELLNKLVLQLEHGENLKRICLVWFATTYTRQTSVHVL